MRLGSIGNTRALFALFLLVFTVKASMGQTSLLGKVTDAETKEAILFCNVGLYRNGVLIRVEETDLDGNYIFSNIDPGTYDMEMSYVGYQTQQIKGVLVQAGKSNQLNVELTQGVILDEILVVDYKVPLIEQDNTTSGGIITGDQIRNLPTKNIQQLAAATAGLSSIDGEAITIRGSRTDATNYYIDGIRIFGSLPPQSEIDQMQVITGGIEARYGDVTGGVISITTKGPSNTFSGGIELESSKYLDPFGYNEANLYLSGPILKNSNRESILGYRFSGRFLQQDEDNPSAVGIYRVPPALLESLEDDPIKTISNSPFSAAEFLRNDDVELQEARTNNQNRSVDLTGKIDARIGRNIDVSFSGSYRDIKDRFVPSSGWYLLNYKNNPVAFDNRLRGNFRVRHRISDRTRNEVRGKRNSSFIQNAAYAVQFGYERADGRREDIRHGDNLFRYGHVGTFEFDWIPVEGESNYSGNISGLAHAGFLRTLNGPFTRSDYNPVFGNYNKDINQDVFESYNAFNGFVSGSFNSIWNFYNNVGSVYNTSVRFDSDLYTANITASFDLLPGGSDGGRHSIEIGLLHEQSYNRQWGVSPFRLWEVARLQANRHIIGVDTSNIIGSFQGVVVPNITFPEFEKLIVENDDLRFFRAVRELTGSGLHDYVNVDAIHPDDLSLDMFSPLELTDQRLISFYGYDYLGNKLSNSVSFDEFFNGVGEDGRRNFLIGPHKPVYQAAYIQDKFVFKDIIFRLGLRVDRYDANTKVLRDPYSLYEIMNASDFFERFGGVRPGGVGDGWKVYVTGENSAEVKAYRNGDQWYFPNGSPANDGNIIFGGEIVYPRYYNENVNNIKDNNYNPDQSFTDYEPQISWMPRLAVSFPISDVANFFAHYDILVQRPPSNTVATPFDWYYFEDDRYTENNPFNNSNLKPEKTIDYEVGFQQKLSNFSALKINAYYKELRDMIQQRSFLYMPSPITSYVTYGNSDFATVKGFSFQYDLRRVDNVSFQANYTLQFADGTGSNVNSQRGLTTRGNLRTLFPLDRDERHAFKFIFDYRYGSGRNYNGPVLFDKEILANMGLNIQSFMVSGRPYTRRIRAEPFGGSGFFGSINGARKPWTFTLDLRLDKSFRLPTVNPQRPFFLNISLRVLNILDTRNIRSVYPVSGSPYDSGFLLSPDGQSTLNNIRSTGELVVEAGRDETAFIDAYRWLLTSPFNFYSPRRIFLGARFDF